MKEQIPDFQSIMHPILDLLGDGQPHTSQDVLAQLAKRFNLTDEHLLVMVPSGQQPLFKNRVTWAISYLKNAGLLQYAKRGVYQITKDGQAVLQEGINYINLAYLKKFDAYKAWQSTFAQAEEKNTAIVAEEILKTPEELIGESLARVNDKIATDLLEIIKSKTPAQFEKLVLLLLNAMGYGMMEEKAFEVVGKSGDYGIDGIIYQDKLGIDRIYVQAKKWNDNKIQSKEIRDFIGSLSLRGTNKGVFITTSQFTDDALRTASMNPQNTIILIDGKKLTDFAIQFNVGVQVKKQYELKDVDQDFLDEL
ncbi:MAG: Restriction system protein [Flavisolibacter sp.]|jgi:restriction system protein|nr:Restriction system protein [Flavisolibacter sp.]